MVTVTVMVVVVVDAGRLCRWNRWGLWVEKEKVMVAVVDDG